MNAEQCSKKRLKNLINMADAPLLFHGLSLLKSEKVFHNQDIYYQRRHQVHFAGRPERPKEPVMKWGKVRSSLERVWVAYLW